MKEVLLPDIMAVPREMVRREPAPELTPYRDSALTVALSVNRRVTELEWCVVALGAVLLLLFLARR